MSRKDGFRSDGDVHFDPDANRDAVHGTWGDTESLSIRVITAVAAVTGAPPERMRPLYEVIDPEALDRLFEHASEGARQSAELSVSFRYEGCVVTVLGDGELSVSVPDDDHF